MARVTVEDCVEIVPNRFDLVLLAAQRARALSLGDTLTVPRNNDKNPIVALREIAEQTVEITRIEDAILQGLRKVKLTDTDEANEQSDEEDVLPIKDLDGSDDDDDLDEDIAIDDIKEESLASSESA